MNQARKLYWKLAQVLVKAELVSRYECDVIARVGTRKEWAYKRHILDLCEYVLEKKNIEDDCLVNYLERCIQWAKGQSTLEMTSHNQES